MTVVDCKKNAIDLQKSHLQNNLQNVSVFCTSIADFQAA